MADTPQEVQKLYRDRLMPQSGEERMRMGSAMFDAAREMVLASISTSLHLSIASECRLSGCIGTSFQPKPWPSYPAC